MMMKAEDHRKMNTVLIIATVVVTVVVVVILILSNKHSMQDCEDRLFEKLTKMKAPKFSL